MSRARFCRTTLVAGAALLAAASAAPAGAQDRHQLNATVWLGAGGTMPLSEPGVDRRVGPGALAAVELSVTPWLAVRAEASVDAQRFDTRADGPLGGDLQQGRRSVLVRVSPTAVGGVTPYALAGAGLFWQSRRVELRDLSDPVPEAAYQETSSHMTPGALAGAGAAFTIAHTRVFAETRWTRVRAEDGATMDLSLIGGVTLPLGW